MLRFAATYQAYPGAHTIVSQWSNASLGDDPGRDEEDFEKAPKKCRRAAPTLREATGLISLGFLHSRS